MGVAEFSDLREILEDGRRIDALADCLALLKALPWASPAEKMQVWRQLPIPLRHWLSQSVQHHQPA